MTNRLNDAEVARTKRENAELDEEYRVSEEFICCDDPECEGNSE